jgi:hypothetical protein
MLRPRNPSNRMIRIKVNPRPSLFLRYDLKPVVINEHIRRATLQFICRDSLLDGLDRGCND